MLLFILTIISQRALLHFRSEIELAKLQKKYCAKIKNVKISCDSILWFIQKTNFNTFYSAVITALCINAVKIIRKDSAPV